MATGFTRLLKRVLRRYRGAADGVTAIEFALVGGPFIWLLCVVFETGIMLFAEYRIENGTAQAGRLIRTGQVQAEGMSASKFKSIVCDKLTGFLDCASKLYVDVRHFPNFQSIKLPQSRVDNQLSPEVTTGSQFQPGGQRDVVVVRAFYDWQLFTPGVTLLANLAGGRRVLTGATAFRNEPYAN
jgi:Flp pilus assembly protein TadG